MRRALALLATALIGVVLGGWWLSATWHISLGYGIYCAIGVASTEGCSAAPTTGAGRTAAVVLILVLIPVLAAVFALLNGMHVAKHVRASEERIKAHFEKRLDEHHKALTGRKQEDGTERDE